jgi:hypothetical protein
MNLKFFEKIYKITSISLSCTDVDMINNFKKNSFLYILILKLELSLIWNNIFIQKIPL